MSFLAPIRRWFAPVPTVDVAIAGRSVLIDALTAWERDYIDPPKGMVGALAERSRSFIDSIYRGDLGLGWSWVPPYQGNGWGAWCGAFAAYAWRHNIPLEVRRKFFASTFRLDAWASYRAVDDQRRNLRPPRGPYRLCVELDEHSTALPDGVTPQAGDILLMGPPPVGHNHAWGVHVALVDRYDDKACMFYTVEGNAAGRGPGGNVRLGVARSVCPVGLQRTTPRGFFHARRLIRPAPIDLVS